MLNELKENVNKEIMEIKRMMYEKVRNISKRYNCKTNKQTNRIAIIEK